MQSYYRDRTNKRRRAAAQHGYREIKFPTQEFEAYEWFITQTDTAKRSVRKLPDVIYLAAARYKTQVARSRYRANLLFSDRTGLFTNCHYDL